MFPHLCFLLFPSRIDFKNDPTTAVPASLQKSAVLLALEEEERQKQGHASKNN